MADKSVEVLDDITPRDISDLCDAAEDLRSPKAVVSAGLTCRRGKRWRPTGAASCWCRGGRGVGRLDSVIAGSAQLVSRPRTMKRNRIRRH